MVEGVEDGRRGGGRITTSSEQLVLPAIEESGKVRLRARRGVGGDRGGLKSTEEDSLR